MPIPATSGPLRTLTPSPFLAFVYRSLSRRSFSAALKRAQSPRLERTASEHSLAQTRSLLLVSFTSKQTEQLSCYLLPMSRPRHLLVSQPTQCGRGPVSHWRRSCSGRQRHVPALSLAPWSLSPVSPALSVAPGAAGRSSSLALDVPHS